VSNNKFFNLKFFGNPYFILVFYILITIIAGAYQYYLGINSKGYTYINNFLVFKNAFFHLIESKDLYFPYLEDYRPVKYSPSFALLMAPFALMPTLLGLVSWCLFNTLALFYAIRLLPIKDTQKSIIYWLILIDLITTIQNLQANALMVALMLFAFVSFERRKVFWAALFIALSFYIKIFGLAACILFILYPDKIKFILSMAFWMVVFFFLPLLVIDVEQLHLLYSNWWKVLSIDHDMSLYLSFSVMGILQSWFGLQVNKFYIQLIGIVLLCLPLIHYKHYKKQLFRLLMVCSILIWVIIFNHKAESNTFIIAMVGISLWFVSQKPTVDNIALIILTLLLVSLSPTDLFPKSLRENYVVPYVLKALPCVLVWIKINYQLVVRGVND